MDGHITGARHKSRVSMWTEQGPWLFDLPANAPPSTGTMYAQWLEPMPEGVRRFLAMQPSAPPTTPRIPTTFPLSLTFAPHSSADSGQRRLTQPPATVPLTEAPGLTPMPAGSSGEDARQAWTARQAGMQEEITNLKNENTALWMKIENLEKMVETHIAHTSWTPSWPSR